MDDTPGQGRAAAYVPQIAQTELGPVEFAVVGTGAPVVVVHGSPAGSTPRR